MGTIKKTEEFEKFIFEFWNPVNQALSKTEKICPKFNTCDFVERETLGYEILICETYPNACELNPFQVNEEYRK